jgi:hypothetical protein
MKRRWVKGLSLGKFRFRDGPGYRTYYFVDDRHGGRMAATDLEVELWKRTVGPIQFGPDEPPRRATEKRSAGK